MLRHVRHREDQRRAGHVGAPGVVPLHVRDRGRDVQPAVSELDDARPVRLEPCAEVGAAVRRDGRHVPRRQEVDAGVVGEEELRGVEARRGRKAAAARGGGVVRQLRRISGMVREELGPAGVARDGGEQQHLLQRVERLGRLARGEGERPVGDRGALGEAARAAAVDRLDQREGRCLDEAAGRGGIGVEHDPAFRGEGVGPGAEPEAAEDGAGSQQGGADELAAGDIEHGCLSVGPSAWRDCGLRALGRSGHRADGSVCSPMSRSSRSERASARASRGLARSRSRQRRKVPSKSRNI